MRKVWEILGRCLLALLALLVATYVGDYVSLRFQIPNRAQTTDLQIQPLLAVPEKNHKTEFMLEDPQTQTCSNSLFPQMGYQPCWYVSRHTQQQINM